MRSVLFMSLLFFLLGAAPASAQSAVTAGRAESFDASLGYSYFSHPASPSTRVGLNGVDATATIGIIPRLGIRADLGYARSGNVFGTPTHSGVLSYLAGPVFYPIIQTRFDTYTQALFGGARVSGPVPINGGILIGGYAGGFAWAIGGGVDYRLTHSIALRTGVDYMRTGYFGPTLAIQGQSNFRATVAVVYLFGTRQRKHR
jgi:opacity protein-like surface antigen